MSNGMRDSAPFSSCTTTLFLYLGSNPTTVSTCPSKGGLRPLNCSPKISAVQKMNFAPKGTEPSATSLLRVLVIFILHSIRHKNGNYCFRYSLGFFVLCLTKSSSAASGMILRRPTFRLASWRRETRVATVRGDNPNLRAASAMPTASTVLSRCIASASPFMSLLIVAA